MSQLVFTLFNVALFISVVDARVLVRNVVSAPVNPNSLLNNPESLACKKAAHHFAAFLAANATNPIADPTCKKGVASSDLKVCCIGTCGSCDDADHLCDDPGKYQEATGKLADNCCRARILSKSVSCDGDHAPCVLSDAYANKLNNYEQDLPVRSAMQDCNKALDVVRGKHALGMRKGDLLTKLFVDGESVFQNAISVAAKVPTMCRQRMQEIEKDKPTLEKKIASADAADKQKDKLSGMSKVDKLENDLDDMASEVRLYEMLIENAESVQKLANNGLHEDQILKDRLLSAGDISDIDMKIRSLTASATQASIDADFLHKQYKDANRDYNCSIPTHVDHTTSMCQDGNTKFSPKCNIACAEGYDGEGTKNSLRCLKQGKFGKELYGEWLGMATCVARNCGPPLTIMHSQATKQEIRFPNIAVHTCEEGFSVDSDINSAKSFVVACGATGLFVKKVDHKCMPVKCGAAPKLPNTHPVLGTYFFTDIAKYECVEGFTLDETPGGVNTFEIDCPATAHFVHTQECRRVRCGKAPDFTHTSLNGDAEKDNFFGDEVHYECTPGYTLDQIPLTLAKYTLVCGASGEFEVRGNAGATLPKCMPVSAGMSPEITYGNLPPRLFYYGDWAVVTADTGYSFKETPTEGTRFTLTVGVDGKFKNLQKFLPVSCGAPLVVTKAVSTFENAKAVFGDVLEYECENGYSIDKTDQPSSKAFSVDCEADASFSKISGEGECVNIDDCAEHTCGAHGECVDKLLDYECDCDRGYEQTIDNETQEKLCGNIDDCGATACGVGRCEDLLEDFKCHCPTGWEQTGEDDEKTCTRKICGLPPIVTNAATEPVSALEIKQVFQDIPIYVCKEGHTTSGMAGGKNHFNISCLADQSFTETKSCLPVTCGEIPLVEHSSASVNTAVFNESVRYECNEGYTIDGTATGDSHFSVTCQANGMYGDTQECKPVTCGEPDEIANSFKTSGQVYFPTKRTYTCFEGFSVNGEASGEKFFDVECQSNGKLTQPKQCQAVSCGEAEEHINALYATVETGLVRYPQIAEVKCQDGYTMNADAEGDKLFGVSCNKDGRYAGYNRRECNPVICGAPPVFAKATKVRIYARRDYMSNANQDACRYSSAYVGHYLAGCVTGDNCKNYGNPDDAKAACNAKGESCGGILTAARGNWQIRRAASPTWKQPAGTSETSFTKDCSAKEDLNFEEQAEYLCDKGYTAGGESDAPTKFKVECLANGQISSPPLDMQCRDVDACEKHTCGPKGTCIDVVGESVDAYNCECSHGYEVQLVRGEKYCGNIDDCGHDHCGVGQCVDLVGGYTCNCPVGYYLGDRDGEKSCIPVRCLSSAPTIQHGRMLSTHSGPIDFPKSLRYECNTGYSTDSSVADAKMRFHAACKPDGQFYGMQTCQKITCGSPYRLPYADVQSRSPSDAVYYQDTVQYKCKHGKTMGATPSGRTEFSVQCRIDGTLTRPQVCEAIRCGQAPYMPKARPSISGVVSYGAHLSYACDTGYTLDGGARGARSYRRSCLTTGEFSSVARSQMCQPISRTLPRNAVQNAYLIELAGNRVGFLATRVRFGSNSTENQTLSSIGNQSSHVTVRYTQGVKFRCHSGYSVSGSLSGATVIASSLNAQGQFVPPLPTKCILIVFRVRGRIVDARNGNGLSGARVSVGSSSATTQHSGYYTLTVPPGTYNVRSQRSGFITTQRNGIAVNGNINSGGVGDSALAPVMRPDEWRLVIKWGQTPRDLDTYVRWGWNTIYYGRRYANYARMTGRLEQDVTRGFGPETVYLSGVGNCVWWSYYCDIRYYIYDYSRTGRMRDISNAEITVYQGSRVVTTIRIRDCRNLYWGGNLWYPAFIIDGRRNTLKWQCNR